MGNPIKRYSPFLTVITHYDNLSVHKLLIHNIISGAVPKDSAQHHYQDTSETYFNKKVSTTLSNSA